MVKKNAVVGETESRTSQNCHVYIDASGLVHTQASDAWSENSQEGNWWIVDEEESETANTPEGIKTHTTSR